MNDLEVAMIDELSGMPSLPAQGVDRVEICGP